MNQNIPLENMCGVLIARMPSKEKAAKSAKAMKNCPRLIASGVNSDVFIGVYIIPKDLTWWLKVPEEKPELLGAESVQSFFTESLMYPEKFELRLPETKSEIAPCGSNCLECPSKEEYQCPGCPATIHYPE